MNTQHFRYAVEVERTGSISQAAENLYISQPTISKVIKELEDTLGITIFQRTPRGTVATEKGAQFLAYAREALAQVDKMERLSRPDDGHGPVLSAALPHADYLLQGLLALAADTKIESGARISVEETDAMQAMRGVQDGRYKLAVIRYPAARETYFADYLKNNGLMSESIWEFEPLILAGQNSPIAAIDRLSEDKLEGYIEIQSDDGRAPYLSGGEDGADRDSRMIFVNAQSERLELLSIMPDAYLWASPTPAKRLTRFGLVQRRCPGTARRWKDVLIFRRGKLLGDLERRFVNRLYAAKNEVTFRASDR